MKARGHVAFVINLLARARFEHRFEAAKHQFAGRLAAGLFGKRGSRQTRYRYRGLAFCIRTPRACNAFETVCSESANRFATSAMLPLSR